MAIQNNLLFVVLILGILIQCAISFTTPHDCKSFIVLPSSSSRCFMTTNDDAPKRIRRKRKEGKTVQDVTTNANLEPSIPSEKPAVEMEVMDVRDIVSGTSNDSSTTSTTANEAMSTGSTSFSSSSSSSTTTSTSSTSSSEDDSLERLLADAKKMRMEASTKDDDDGGISAPNAIKSAISTIVTIDFFVVCGLLLWFLAGIFCSYVIKDDTVQISFNMIFQPVVQPALGILMIGSAAGGT